MAILNILRNTLFFALPPCQIKQASVRLPAGMVGSPSAIRPQASAVRAAPKLTGAIRSRRRSFAAAESVSNHSVITNAPSNLPTAPKMNKDRPAAAATTDRAGAAAAAAALAALMLTAQPSIAADAASTFANRCAGCHAGGGNVTQVMSKPHHGAIIHNTRSSALLVLIPDDTSSMTFSSPHPS